MRLIEDGKAPVAVWHGPVPERAVIELIRQLGLRRLFVLFLRRMQVTVPACPAVRALLLCYNRYGDAR